MTETGILRSEVSKVTWTGRTCVLTGASSGIGQAIAQLLSEQGAQLRLIGRRVRDAALPGASWERADFEDEDETDAVARRLAQQCDRVDLLVHSAGCLTMGPLAEADTADLDKQYRVNVRAAHVLTQALLPALKRARGQVVFVNSTVGWQARAGLSQYSASKHALRALADALRDEVNADGVRVLSLYLGRTATPMQEAVIRAEGGIYHPENLMQPEDVAAMTLAALSLPATAEVTEIRMRPAAKPRTR